MPSFSIRAYSNTLGRAGGEVSIPSEVYFVARKSLRAGVADFRVIRGAVGDHYLVLMKLNLKLRKQESR